MKSRVLAAHAAVLAVLAAAGGAGTARAQALQGDRYGPEPSAPQASLQASNAQDPGLLRPGQGDHADEQGAELVRASGRMLSWPGKVSSSVRSPSSTPARAYYRAAVARGPASGAYRPQPMAPARRMAAIDPSSAHLEPSYEPASPALTSTASPHYGLVRAAPSSAEATPALAGAPTRPLPQSIYDQPAAAIAPQAALQTASASPAAHAGWAPPRRPWSGAYGDNVRLYSVHRAYGLKPDPAPIPPQFFAATGDAANPAGPSITRRTVSGSGTAAQAARAVQASDADTASAQP